MIQIQLMISGREETYVARGITLKTTLDAYALSRRYADAQGDYSEELLSECADFICACFGGAFTVDQLLGGYRGSAFRLYPSILAAVIGYAQDEIINFPEPARTNPTPGQS